MATLERCPEKAEEIQGIDHGSPRRDTAYDLDATEMTVTPLIALTRHGGTDT